MPRARPTKSFNAQTANSYWRQDICSGDRAVESRRWRQGRICLRMGLVDSTELRIGQCHDAYDYCSRVKEARSYGVRAHPLIHEAIRRSATVLPALRNPFLPLRPDPLAFTDARARLWFPGVLSVRYGYLVTRSTRQESPPPTATGISH